MGSGDHFSQADVPPTGHTPCSPTAGSPTSLMTPIRHLFPSHLINGTLSTLVFLTPKSCGQRQHAPWRSRVWTRSSVSIHHAACGIVRRQTRRTGRRRRKRPDAFPIDHAAQLGESERTSSRNTHTNTHKHIYTHHKAGGWRPCTCPAKVLLLFSPDKLRPLPADLPLRPAMAFLRAFYDAARLQREGKKNEIRLQRHWHHPVTPNWSRCGVTSQP